VHEFVGHRAGKTIAPAVGVEPQQMVAINLGFSDPQFADQATVGQGFIHSSSPVVVVGRESCSHIATQYD
jgi:hypothetical protein